MGPGGIRRQVFFFDNVEILDISFGGVSLNVDRGLTVGKEYLMTLVEKGKSIAVKGIVVRSALSEPGERTDGERVAHYAVSMNFKDGQLHKVAELINSL
jgi:hypothetical protein